MEIIVIDDGINEKFARICSLSHNIEVLDSLDIIERTNYDNSLYSHGSICAAIIKKYSPDCEIGSIKVLDSNTMNGNSQQLQMALIWCLNNNITLINMSLGSILYNDYEPIRLLIAKLIANGCIIIAARHNTRSFSVPACLSGVIGVKTISSYKDSEYTVLDNYLDQVDILASSQHQICVLYNETHFAQIANSYAAPVVTSIIYNILQKEKHTNTCSIKYKLINLSRQTNNFNVCYSMRPDFIEKALVFNYSCLKNADNFFCIVSKWLDKPDLENFVIKDKSVNLIILPHCHKAIDLQLEKEIKKFLLKNKSKINGILYGGKLSNEFTNFCNNEIHCLIFDENAYYRLSDNSSLPNGDTKKPIIRINGNIEALDLSILLKKAFSNDRYTCLMVSDTPYSYLYNFEYIPNPLLEDKMFRHLEEKFDPDIFLFSSSSLVKINSDIQIIIKDISNILEFNNSTITISKNLIHVKINTIYKYIIKLLNE